MLSDVLKIERLIIITITSVTYVRTSTKTGSFSLIINNLFHPKDLVNVTKEGAINESLMYVRKKLGYRNLSLSNGDADTYAICVKIKMDMTVVLLVRLKLF